MGKTPPLYSKEEKQTISVMQFHIMQIQSYLIVGYEQYGKNDWFLAVSKIQQSVHSSHEGDPHYFKPRQS